MRDARTIEHVTGQRIMAGFHGTGLNTDLRFLIDTIGVGGIILFSRNITGRRQLENLCNSATDYARSTGLPRLLIAIDQEGGSVARLKAPDFTEFPDASFMTTEQDAVDFARTTAKELTGAGVNMNMAPVLDVAPEGFDSIMSKRSFGSDPARVSRLGETIITTLQSAGILAVAKHFPGIGRTTLDSHMNRPDLEANVDSLDAYELIPFYAAVNAGVSGIMLSHIRYTGIDPEWPASLSYEIAVRLLRDKMGYDGVVFTDDLEMGAIRNHYDTTAITRQLGMAEIDVALVCETRQVIEDIFEALCRRTAGSDSLTEKAFRSAARIEALKSKLTAS